MALWDRVHASIYDRINAGAERGVLGLRRAALLAEVTGEVLEVGAGTGANLPHYVEGARVVASEPSEGMRERLAAKIGTARVPVEISPASAESLPFEDGRFGTVVATLMLCSVGDVDRVLSEIHRVLEPAGKLVFLEHGGGHPGRRGVWQRRLDPVWSRVTCGCHLTRDAAANIERAGFRFIELEEFDPKGVPAIIRPFVQGVART